MIRKLALSAIAAGAVALGTLGATAPAQAQVYFGFGFGPGWHHPHHHVYRRCGWVPVRRHHHWVNVWRCRPVWY
ncbi:MAG: hypothetical protein KGO53_01975 [Alphaproteobacteria bacterium]|nr:hypothetical protein [Alphaproteobacteria bacterium]